MIYVSITGLRLKSHWHSPRFFWLAIRAMRQALAAPGNLKAEARKINGVHHTLTVWESEAAMRAYLVQDAHLQAMKAFRSIATGSTLGYLAEAAPDWQDVHALWLEKGREV
jgi:quinol monooxygenase YgiN